jgi:hypothetical protein
MLFIVLIHPNWFFVFVDKNENPLFWKTYPEKSIDQANVIN